MQRESSSPRFRFWKKDGQMLKSMNTLSVIVVSRWGAVVEEEERGVGRDNEVERKSRERRVN